MIPGVELDYRPPSVELNPRLPGVEMAHRPQARSTTPESAYNPIFLLQAIDRLTKSYPHTRRILVEGPEHSGRSTMCMHILHSALIHHPDSILVFDTDNTHLINSFTNLEEYMRQRILYIHPQYDSKPDNHQTKKNIGSPKHPLLQLIKELTPSENNLNFIIFTDKEPTIREVFTHELPGTMIVAEYPQLQAAYLEDESYPELSIRDLNIPTENIDHIITLGDTEIGRQVNHFAIRINRVTSQVKTYTAIPSKFLQRSFPLSPSTPAR